MRLLTLRVRLVILVIAGVLPLLAFNLGSVYSDYRGDRTRAGREALDLARGLAAATDSELRTNVAVLQVLALSDSLAADEHPVGQPSGPEFLRAWSSAPEGTLQMMSEASVPVLVAFSRLSEFGWTVVVAVPMVDLTGPAWHSALISLAVGLGLLALGLVLAQLISWSILGPIAALWHLATAPDDTAESRLAVTGLWEVDEVAKVLLGEARRRRDATAELSRHVDALERSNMDLDDFAYIASHDLKEPLRGIANNARFLHEDYAERLPQEGVDRLSRIGYLSQRMEQLINDLLHFSRLGHQDLAVQMTDLNEVIRDIEMMSETMLNERQAVIVIPQDLPRIRCDKTRITEVFRNLITNAVKYNDSVMKRVEVGYRDVVKRNDGVERQVFYVKDNGIGVAGEFHEDIFRIFKRLNAEDDDKKGTGVGLTFVRKIIEHSWRTDLARLDARGGRNFLFHD